MKRFQTITTIFVIALALSSAAVAQQQPRAQKATPKIAKQKMLTARGEVSTVDVSSKTLTLKVDTKTETFAFDEKTQIIGSTGKPVEPSAITAGMKATVTYTEQDGKKLAHRVRLQSARAEKAKPQKKTM